MRLDPPVARRPLSDDARGTIFFLLSHAAFLAMWEAYVRFGFATKLLPAPSAVASVAFDALASPFYNNGENEKGIGVHLIASLGHVCGGGTIARVIDVPFARPRHRDEVMADPRFAAESLEQLRRELDLARTA